MLKNKNMIHVYSMTFDTYINNFLSAKCMEIVLIILKVI